MIPAEAVEAAARAIDASKAEGCGCCAYPEFTAEEDKRADELDINVRALLIAKEALEAAAPHMQAGAKAEALEEAAAEIVFWNKAGADDDITQQETINWLRARAATYEPSP